MQVTIRGLFNLYIYGEHNGLVKESEDDWTTRNDREMHKKIVFARDHEKWSAYLVRRKAGSINEHSRVYEWQRKTEAKPLRRKRSKR